MHKGWGSGSGIQRFKCLCVCVSTEVPTLRRCRTAGRPCSSLKRGARRPIVTSDSPTQKARDSSYIALEGGSYCLLHLEGWFLGMVASASLRCCWKPGPLR